MKIDFSNQGLTEIPSDIDVHVTTLYLRGNQITEIKNLALLTSLTELHLYNNQITEIKNLELLFNLTELYLGGNQITEIKNLESLTNLTILFLDGNQITLIDYLCLPDCLFNQYPEWKKGKNICQNIIKMIEASRLRHRAAVCIQREYRDEHLMKPWHPYLIRRMLKAYSSMQQGITAPKYKN